MIYFDQETKENLVFRIINKLNRGGLFFIGMAETLILKDSKIKMLNPSIYRKI
jgi:chemotaxis protein methyltransferase CheR